MSRSSLRQMANDMEGPGRASAWICRRPQWQSCCWNGPASIVVVLPGQLFACGRDNFLREAIELVTPFAPENEGVEPVGDSDLSSRHRAWCCAVPMSWRRGCGQGQVRDDDLGSSGQDRTRLR